MTPEELAAQLFEAATTRAKSAGRHLGEGADTDLHKLTLDGAVELLKIMDPDKRAASIEQAERDIERLIDYALENAAAKPGYASDLLGELTYFPAKLRFCPCRPFC